METYKTYHIEPIFYVSAAGVVPVNNGEVYTIEVPDFDEPPIDYGETNVWIDGEIVDIDHRYVYVEGSSNLIEGMLLRGNIKSSEDAMHNQNPFNFTTTIKKDGTYTIPIEYKSLTDEGFIIINSIAGLNHPRGRVILDTYGEEFENMQGDLVRERYAGKTEQLIELIIPLNPEYEDAPDQVDVTRDGDETKLLLSDDILFEFGKSDITEDGNRVIQEIATWLETQEYGGQIKIYGHTDNIGGDDINQPLSENRAENVYQSLLSHLEETTFFDFEVKGFGKNEPIATNEDEEGRQRNRRVEIILGESSEN
ncbi:MULTISPECIES: OmpA family protein [Bacillaceae]|uniref:OmpA family protein n=1 Tax=Evansella alkalicola TaxID=745819 RepID=A0ABS6JRV5_9BACI|nr:OmpA family protein [Litchfieldia alkalitelluris]MBU9721296.1 OmpA family protein [Bacillus alkalicola]